MPVVSVVQAGGGPTASPLTPAAVSTFLDRSAVRLAGIGGGKPTNLVLVTQLIGTAARGRAILTSSPVQRHWRPGPPARFPAHPRGPGGRRLARSPPVPAAAGRRRRAPRLTRKPPWETRTRPPRPPGGKPPRDLGMSAPVRRLTAFPGADRLLSGKVTNNGSLPEGRGVGYPDLPRLRRQGAAGGPDLLPVWR